MPEIDVEAQREQVEEAARHLYEADQKIQKGEVTSKALRELGEAYQTYVSVRSRRTLSKKKSFLRRLRFRQE